MISYIFCIYLFIYTLYLYTGQRVVFTNYRLSSVWFSYMDENWRWCATFTLSTQTCVCQLPYLI